MGLRGRLLLLVFLPVVPALGLAVHTNLEQRRLGRTRVESDSVRGAQLVAASELGLVEATRQHLAAWARLPQARGTNRAAFDVFFTSLRKIYTDYTDFGLLETNGDLVSSSRGGDTRCMANSAHLRGVLKMMDFTVGNYDPGDGITPPSLVFGYPVFDPKGQLKRVLYAALDLAVLRRAAARAQVPAGGEITLLDRDGRILVHLPDADEWAGRPGTELLGEAGSRLDREGTFELSGPGGVSRLYAFTAIRTAGETPLRVSVGIPTALAYAETNSVLVRNLTLLLAVAALALLAAWSYASRSILWPIHALSEATRRMTGGDLGARTGVATGRAELGRLAQAFDEMAASLQAQRREIEQAEANVRKLNATLELRVRDRTAELEAANRELEAFSYSVSHDLRAPLRHINGFVELLQEQSGPSLGETGARYLHRVSSSASQMGKLIDDLLAFSRLGRAELRRTRVRADSLVRDAILDLAQETQGRNIQWQIGSLPVVTGDRALLKQVWINLLSNAVKYTRRRNPAVIRIRSVERAGEWEFQVQDNGAGFDMVYAGKLFGVFQRLHHAEEFEGTGIGLANVRRTIERHGGRTWAEGAVGVGATFYFTLPIEAEAEGPAQDARGSDSAPADHLAE